MREKKFRAWDGKKFLDFDFIGFDRNGQNEVYLNREQVASNVTVVEYTGIKDKNDVEIYEGDVVKIPENCSEDAEPKRTVYIEWNNDWAAFVFAPMIRLYGKLIGGDITIADAQLEQWQIEVVGNIYEHHDLVPQ